MKKTLLLGALLAACSLANAQTPTGFGISTEVGTTGIGAHLSFPIQSGLDVRVGVNAFNYSYEGSTSNADYDVKLKAMTVDALLDWYPTGNSFRFTTGLVYNGNKLDVHGVANSSGSFTYNGNTYDASNVGSIDGRADFKKVAPYLGIGFGKMTSGAQAGWSFTSDFGVMFQGSPSTTLSNSGCTLGTTLCDRLATDLSAENAKLRDKLSDFNLYPVVRVGATYRF